MKTWNAPAIEALNIKGTQYDPNGGEKEDGQYISYDNKYTIPTYGPSTGNSGTPSVDVQ